MRFWYRVFSLEMSSVVPIKVPFRARNVKFYVTALKISVQVKLLRIMFRQNRENCVVLVIGASPLLRDFGTFSEFFSKFSRWIPVTRVPSEKIGVWGVLVISQYFGWPLLRL